MYRAEEFSGKMSDDSARAEYWLENMQRVLDEMLCLPEDFLRCDVSLLKEEGFSLNYVSKRYLDMKKKEFLELKLGNRSVAEYGREIVQLSEYVYEMIPIKEELLRLKDGLYSFCGSLDHFKKVCLIRVELNNDLNAKVVVTSTRVDVIRVRIEASTLDVIAGTFPAFVIVYALFDSSRNVTLILLNHRQPTAASYRDVAVAATGTIVSGNTGSSIARQLSFEGKESQLVDNSISTSPSKPNFVMMNVIKNGVTSLEEQVVSLIKMVESLTISFKERDDQMAFIMKRILDLIGKRLTNEEVSNENL
ncbi:hypothetical protein Gotur_033321 [Gossypium turneri]